MTNFVDRPILPWWDRVALLVKKTDVPVLTIDYPVRLAFDLRTIPRARVIWSTLRALQGRAGN